MKIKNSSKLISLMLLGLISFSLSALEYTKDTETEKTVTQKTEINAEAVAKLTETATKIAEIAVETATKIAEITAKTIKDVAEEAIKGLKATRKIGDEEKAKAAWQAFSMAKPESLGETEKAAAKTSRDAGEAFFKVIATAKSLFEGAQKTVEEIEKAATTAADVANKAVEETEKAATTASTTAATKSANEAGEAAAKAKTMAKKISDSVTGVAEAMKLLEKEFSS